MSKYLKGFIIICLTLALGLGSLMASGGSYDIYKLTFGEARWQTKINNFIDAVTTDFNALRNEIGGLATLVTNWAIEDNIVTIVTATPTYSDGDTFTLPGDYTSRMTANKIIQAYCGADGMKYSTVASSSYAGGTTTVNLNNSVLTSNLTYIYVVATRDGLFPNGPGYVVARDYGMPGKAALDDAIAAISTNERTLVVGPGTWTISDNITVPANITLHPERGAVFAVATGKTLTVNGGLNAGLYQIFSWTSTGKVDFSGSKSIPVVYPEWFGGKGDGSTDDNASIAAAILAAKPTSTLQFGPNIYRTSPITCLKSLIWRGTKGFASASGTILKAAGNQTHVLRLEGGGTTFPDTRMIGAELHQICLDGGGYTISVGLLDLFCGGGFRASYVDLQGAAGRAIHARYWMDASWDHYAVRSVGSDGGEAVYFGERYNADNDNNCNAWVMTNGHFETITGAYFKSHALSALVFLKITGHKFETGLGITNTNPTTIFDFVYGTHIDIYDNHFAGSGATWRSFNYTKVINLTEGSALNFHHNSFFMPGAMTFSLGAITNSITIKNNIDGSFDGTINNLTMDNASISASIIFEPPLALNAAGRMPTIFDLWRTPFIPIHDIAWLTTEAFAVDADVLNSFGTARKKALVSEGDSIGRFWLKKFAGYPGDINVYIRAKITSGTVTLSGGLVGSGTWYPPITVGGSYTIQYLCTITKVQLANSTNYLNYFAICAPNPTTGTLWVDGIYMVPKEGFDIGSATPAGSILPNYIGQDYFDGTAKKWYRSTGLTNNDWVALN